MFITFEERECRVQKLMLIYIKREKCCAAHLSRIGFVVQITSMEQIPSLEAKSSSASQEMFRGEWSSSCLAVVTNAPLLSPITEVHVMPSRIYCAV
jgi:hypothetical protein